MRTDQEFSSYANVPGFPGQSLLTRYQASEDPDIGTAQTVDRMVAAAFKDCHSPQVMRATSIALLFAGPTEFDRVRAIHDWIATNIRFRQDEPFLRFALGLEDELDGLIHPARLLSMSRPEGDCDDFTMLACSMAMCADIQPEIVTIKSNPNKPWLWTHVYNYAHTNEGVIPMDCSQAAQHGYPCGWEPQEGVIERRAWGVMNPPQVGTGLHGYHGLGSDYTDLIAEGVQPADAYQYDPTGAIAAGVDPSVLFPSGGTTGPISSIPNLTGTPASVMAPATSGFNPTALISSLAADATKIGQQLTLPAGYSLSSTGQVVAPLNLSTLFGAGSGGLLLIGGGILALILLSGKK